MSDENVNQPNDELCEEELEDVSGGIIAVVENPTTNVRSVPDGSVRFIVDGTNNLHDISVSK